MKSNQQRCQKNIFFKKKEVQFKHHYKKLKAPYVICGDFECSTAHSKEGIKGTYDHDGGPVQVSEPFKKKKRLKDKKPYNISD